MQLRQEWISGQKSCEVFLHNPADFNAGRGLVQVVEYRQSVDDVTHGRCFYDQNAHVRDRCQVEVCVG